MKKIKSHSPETEQIRVQVLDFLQQNKGLININHVARLINNGKQINNFADMVNGTRTMPEEFIKPLFDTMAAFCSSGGDLIQKEDQQESEEKEAEPENFLKFSFEPSGHSVTGFGLEYSSNGKNISTKIKGKPVVDIMINSKINMAVNFVEQIKKVIETK